MTTANGSGGRIAGLGREVRHALRSLARRPATVAVAVVSLALGIGANAAVFSVVDAALLRPLPYREPGRLVRVWETGMALGERFTGSVSVPNLVDWRTGNRSFAALGAYSPRSVNALEGDGQAARWPAVAVSAETLASTGVAPRLGRVFAAGEDQAGAPPAVVLSEPLWRRSFGADPDVVGRAVTLDGRPHTVVGVMPSGFSFPPRSPAELWTPLVFSEREASARGSHWLNVVGRLAPGVDLRAATAELEAVAARLAAEYPDDQQDRGVLLKTLPEAVVGSSRAILLSLWGAVALVLLIACGNVAHLLLARGAERTRELAVRTALGAGRGRLAMTVLIESLLLAATGGAVGVVLGGFLVGRLADLPGAVLPPGAEVGVDGGVLAVSLAAALVAALVAGLVPAIRAGRTDVVEAIRSGGGRSVSRRDRLRGVLVATEVALAVTVLVGAVLLGESLRRLQEVDSGLETGGVLTAHLAVPAGLAAEDAGRLFARLVAAVAAAPGVEAAGVISFLPFENWGWNGDFAIEGRPRPESPGDAPFAERRRVGGAYFEAVGIRWVAGRPFDDAVAEEAVVVNETLARRYFPDGDALSSALLFGDPASGGSRLPIVGVVSDVRNVGLESATRSEIYFPLHRGAPAEMTLVVRSPRQAADLAADVRAAVHGVDSAVPVYDFETLDAMAARTFASRRFTLLLFSAFAVLALTLAVAGVYGLLSHEVGQRTWEIGLRMAIGARQRDVVAEVVRRGVRLAALGAAFGLGLAAAVTRFLSSQLYSVTATDPAVYATVVGILLAVAALSALGPARRASAVDPVVALRSE